MTLHYLLALPGKAGMYDTTIQIRHIVAWVVTQEHELHTFNDNDVCKMLSNNGILLYIRYSGRGFRK